MASVSRIGGDAGTGITAARPAAARKTPWTSPRWENQPACAGLHRLHWPQACLSLDLLIPLLQGAWTAAPSCGYRQWRNGGTNTDLILIGSGQDERASTPRGNATITYRGRFTDLDGTAVVNSPCKALDKTGRICHETRTSSRSRVSMPATAPGN